MNGPRKPCVGMGVSPKPLWSGLRVEGEDWRLFVNILLVVAWHKHVEATGWAHCGEAGLQPSNMVQKQSRLQLFLSPVRFSVLDRFCLCWVVIVARNVESCRQRASRSLEAPIRHQRRAAQPGFYDLEEEGREGSWAGAWSPLPPL